MCSFCPISCLPYSIFCIHLKKLLSAIVISLHLKEKRLFDSFSAVLQISLTLYVVMSIVLQGKTKPLQFISIQNYNLLMLQYIYLDYWHTCTVYYIFEPLVIFFVRTSYSCIYCCLLSWSCGITVNIKPWWCNNCQWNLWPYSHVEIQCCWFHYRCNVW